MGWKRDEEHVIDLSGLAKLPDRIELYAQGEDEAGLFESRQARHDLIRTTETKPVRNRRGEIEAKEEVTITIQGGTFDASAKKVLLPARRWPDAPFTHVKIVAVYEDEATPDVVLADKVAAE